MRPVEGRTADMTSTALEREMHAGEARPAVAPAMRLLTGLARTLDARSLVPITSAHVDGCLHHRHAGPTSARTVKVTRDEATWR
ncbi:aconitase X catalytic domain-containing protein [Kribbella sp. NBC_01505]|uniref:aconitase X n=1 Tax=Kribbella sp. NBC_01505 TaxID=2903580 RepID=UPI00386C4012